MTELRRTKLMDDTNTDISLSNPLSVKNFGTRLTSFNEQVTAFRTSKFNFKPTWGVSEVRDDVTTTGTGASVSETNGEFKLSSGTSGTGVAELRTKERGQYQAGTEGEIGIGARIPTSPTGNQFAEWGYFYEGENGFGYGVDATGTYVFMLTGGTKTKTYQTSWNRDKLDSTGDSGLTLDLSDGNIFQINFTWYGYGGINFYINTNATPNGKDERILVHTMQVTGSASIVDPNQPLSVRSENNGTASNFDVYVGGRQFSVVDGNSFAEVRDTPVILTSQTVSSTLIPLIAIRKKSTFNGRTNSVRVILKKINIYSDQPLLFFMSYNDTVTDGTWGAIDYTNVNETALEVNKTLTAGNTTQYHAISGGAIGADKNTVTQISSNESLALGDDTAIVLWAQRTDTTDATVSATISLEEEW